MEAELDFLIVGAGLSGIGVACHLTRRFPAKRLLLLEQRATLGGTWDVFRYPGIRCDSDMYSFGYGFRPWPTDATISDGASIRDYLRDTARIYGVDRKIRYRQQVLRAEWSSDEGCWTVTARGEGALAEQAHYRCRFLLLCPGYFRYERGYTPELAGLDSFTGPVIHPQHWPQDFDCTGKRVVVIGSGATAVTLVPALAKRGAHVTMLQRSPAYYLSIPSTDVSVRYLRRVLPDAWVSRAALVRNTLLQLSIYQLCRRYPERARALLLGRVRRSIGNLDMRHFTPRYAPWDERICAVPDGDLFKVLRRGDAQIVTDRIARIEPDGVRLESGSSLPADAIVTATGFDLRLFGGVEFALDGARISLAKRLMHNALMFDGVPNLGMIFGYSNVSWTRRVDLAGAYLCRLTTYLDRERFAVVLPRAQPRHASDKPFVEMMSGYVRRAADQFPAQGTAGPWLTRNHVVLDALRAHFAPIDDGQLQFRRLERASKRRPDARSAPADRA
ncbi:MAG: flavin-containing monooxygenase [Polyangiaceae bacterium]